MDILHVTWDTIYLEVLLRRLYEMNGNCTRVLHFSGMGEDNYLISQIVLSLTCCLSGAQIRPGASDPVLSQVNAYRYGA